MKEMDTLEGMGLLAVTVLIAGEVIRTNRMLRKANTCLEKEIKPTMLEAMSARVAAVRANRQISELKSMVEKFLQPQIVFYVGGQIARRIKMKDTEKVTLAIELDDAKGFPVGTGFDQPPAWSIDDTTIATLAPAADGMSCDVIGQAPGNANVSVAGVAAGVSYAGALVVPVTAGDPAAIKLTAGAPVAQ